MTKKIKNLNLNFGPQHPAAHGVLRLILEQNYRNFDYESPWEGTKYIKEQVNTDDKKN